MINQKSIEVVHQAQFSDHFLKPLYSSYCFSNVPQTISRLFDPKLKGGLPDDCLKYDQYERVVLLFIDGFGWKFFERYAERYPFLQRFLDKGMVSKLTSQFPSTTACHVTTINTGLTPSQSGVFEWFYYEPKLDQVMCPLTYAIAGDKRRDSLQIEPKELFPNETIYQKLPVDSYCFLNRKIVGSTYSRYMMKGSELIGYDNLADGLDELTNFTKQKKGYFFYYYDGIDAAAHRYGIDSPEFEEAIDICFKTLEEKLQGDFATILIADHGLVPVDPKKTVFLNQEWKNKELYIKKSSKGNLIAPCGSCRDFFLFLNKNSLDQATAELQALLKGKAEIYRSDDLLNKGFFGDRGDLLQDKIGDLIILPYEGEAVWWHDPPRFRQVFLAAHGGLTKAEMEIPFLFSSGC